MGASPQVRAMVGTGDLRREKPNTAVDQTDLLKIAPHVFALMLRNITSDGYVLTDSSGRLSKPGCIIAAPSYPRNNPGVDQDYVFNWVRDGAITAIEIAESGIENPSLNRQMLVDYVHFAQLCQQNASRDLSHACFTVDGQWRDWSNQSDGPALQTVALLRAYALFDPATQDVAKQVIAVNVGYLLTNDAYKSPTKNLWEEHSGLSFFARSAQLRCFRELAANTLGVPVPDGVNEAISWLQSALEVHWNGSYYVTMLAPPSPGNAANPSVPVEVGYDPNIDIVSACLYGAVPCTDTRLLATAALLRSQWADPHSPTVYPVNLADKDRGIGPLLGRYPGDTYDGDTRRSVRGGHPWALCTCNLAELYYKLATSIDASGTMPLDELSSNFFAQIGVTRESGPADAAAALRTAGDAMMQAVVFHSDHLELSEQFDGTSGYEKSVSNLTWSYAAFLSAMRARAGRNGRS